MCQALRSTIVKALWCVGSDRGNMVARDIRRRCCTIAAGSLPGTNSAERSTCQNTSLSPPLTRPLAGPQWQRQDDAAGSAGGAQDRGPRHGGDPVRRQQAHARLLAAVHRIREPRAAGARGIRGRAAARGDSGVGPGPVGWAAKMLRQVLPVVGRTAASIPHHCRWSLLPAMLADFYCSVPTGPLSPCSRVSPGGAV
jgi:hypothetical protein